MGLCRELFLTLPYAIKEIFMQRFITHRRGLSAMIVRVVAAAVALTLAGLAMADPPMRVARLGYLSGGVTFSPDRKSVV